MEFPVVRIANRHGVEIAGFRGSVDCRFRNPTEEGGHTILSHQEERLPVF